MPKLKQYLQIACVVLCTFGIVMEAISSKDIWLLLITSGAVAFAVSTKISDRPTRKELNNIKKD